MNISPGNYAIASFLDWRDYAMKSIKAGLTLLQFVQQAHPENRRMAFSAYVAANLIVKKQEKAGGWNARLQTGGY